MTPHVHLITRLLGALGDLTDGLPLELVVAGGAANFALGGRQSRDVDVFVTAAPGFSDAPRSLNTLGTRLQEGGWAVRNRHGTYGGFCACAHPAYPHVDVIVGHEAQTMPPQELLATFDIPQHRALITASGEVIDRRGVDWLLSAPDRIVSHSWRVARAVAYGYPLGATMARAVALCTAAAEGAEHTVKYEIYPGDLDLTGRGGSVLGTVSLEEDTGGDPYPMIRVCQDGTVLRGRHDAQDAVLWAAHGS